MKPVLVDSNIILDIATEDVAWFEWSSEQLAARASESELVINATIYAEVSVGFIHIEDLDNVLPVKLFRRDPLPFEAGFLAGKAYLQYRHRGGRKIAPLPDFFIGAHAAVSNYRLLTRDAGRFRTYYPSIELIAPD